MKKFLFGAFVALATMISSCGSKDDKTPDPPQKTAELIGAWQMESSTIDGKPSSVSECTLKETIVFTEKTIERLSFKKRDGNCSYEKQDPLTYTLLGNTFTTKDGTTTFTITEGKLVIEGVYTDVQGNKKPSTTTYKRITEKELTALRAMEYKAPEKTTDPKALIGAWQIEKATFNGQPIEKEPCEDKQVDIYTANTVTNYDFGFNSNTNRCEFEKGRAVPYTASNGTITKKDDTPENFFVRGNRLVISFIDKDDDDNQGTYEYTFKKLTEAELAEINKLEKK